MNSSGDAAGGYPMASQALFAQRQDVMPIINPVGEVHHGKAEHILVVEDNDGLREIATRILTRAGYEVTAVAARDEALRVSDDKDIRLDLVLTDVIMPGISVREFIDAVHALRPGLAVVLMSGYATDHARAGDSLPGSFPMLTKPFQAATLLRQVSTTLAGS
jgi:DNA-binding NtrC family response regulator